MNLPPPIGAISAGLRYQVRFFWHHALAMLFPDAYVSKVVMEHRGIDAVDDVVVYYTPPGVNDRGSLVDIDYFQLKFHVAQTGSIDADAVTSPAWIGTRESLLTRFAGAWRTIKADHPRARLTFVSNWPWNPSCPFAAMIRDGGHISPEFLRRGSGSAVGKIRKAWQEESGLDDAAFGGFVAALRFSTSAVSQEDAEAWLRDRCQLAGLIPVGAIQDHSPYDDLGARLIERGKTEHTPESLRGLVREQGLVKASPAPYASTFAICSFSRHAHVPATDGAVVVDLTDLFDGRRPVAASVWSEVVRARLDAAIPAVSALRGPVIVAIDAHLSIAWYVGHILNAKCGIRVLLRQRAKGADVSLWDVSKARRPEGTCSWTLTSVEVGDGPDMALVVSVSHSALTDALRSVREALPGVGKLIHAELGSPGPEAIRDGAHARWLADELVRDLGLIVAEFRPPRIHIFPACPGALAFLLGQESNRLGPTTVYEYDFGDPDRTYRPGMATA